MKNNTIKQECQNKFYWLYLTGFFIILSLPLWAFQPFFFPPEWGKAIAFKIIFSIILFFLFYQTVKDLSIFNQIKEKVGSQRKLLAILFSVLGVGILSLILSRDINFSLWTSPHRSGGFVFFCFCILFSIILFLIIKNSDWKKLWNFAFLIGDIIVLFAGIQFFNLLPQKFVAYGRPVSTLSNSILLALYLIFLFFPSLSLFFIEKSKKRYFYLISFLLYVFGMAVSGSRGGYLALFFSGFYFLFFYPQQKKEGVQNFWRKLPYLKIIAVTIALSAIIVFQVANTDIKLPQFLEKNSVLNQVKSRLSINLFFDEPRFSAWQIAWNSIKEKPLLGWGPENFAIAFDKHYDPSLPFITKEWGSWWDRSHNIFFDLSVCYGLLFTLIYFAFFGFLIFKLSKNKEREHEEKVFFHSIISVFIGYFIALIFGFDSVSTYIMLSFVIGYSLFLTKNNQLPNSPEPVKSKLWPLLNKAKKPTIIFFSIILIIFIYQYNLKPLFINANINKAEALIESGNCKGGLAILENQLKKKSFLDAYLIMKYVDFVKLCSKNITQETQINNTKKIMDILEKASVIRPNYTRTWLSLGTFSGILIANEQNPVAKKELLKQAEYYFQKAEALSPRHQEIFEEWAKVYFAFGDWQKMKEKSEKCFYLNKKSRFCNWYLGLAEILLGNKEPGQKYLQEADELGYPVETQESLSQLAIVYTKTQDIKELVPIYESLIKLAPENIQYKATLAFIYKELGQYKKARELALEILKLNPEMKDEINEFLLTLPY